MESCNIASMGAVERFCHLRHNPWCVFISHKKEDESAALAIGEYLTKTAGVNIYLDVKDCELKEAVSTENDQKIVDSITEGLRSSTHLLCLVSDKTRLSWWVPFEIGFAEKQKIDIASLRLKSVDDVPSFLKIKRVINSTDELMKYASEVSFLTPYDSKKKYAAFRSEGCSELKKYVD